MKKYVFTTAKVPGTITVGYDISSLLVFFHNEMELTEPQRRIVLQHFPFTESHIEQLRAKINGEVSEVPSEVTFEVFWEKYGKKVNKKRCESIWKKMTEAQRFKAVMNIWAYDRHLIKNNWREKADPATYLGGEYYENDWSKQ